MDIMSLDYLAEEIEGSIPLIRGLGGISVEPVGFVMMNVKVPGVEGYDEDQIAIVMDDPGMMEWPVILGTPTLYWVMEVIKESEISKLAVPWASSQVQRSFSLERLLFAGFLVPSCPKRALVWGTVVRGFACRDLC